jgi:hypothetical protein
MGITICVQQTFIFYMNVQSFIPQSLVILNLEVRAVSQDAGAVSFIKMVSKTAAVDCTQ